MNQAQTETQPKACGETASDSIKTWHKLVIGVAAIATVLGFLAYRDYTRLKYKGYVVRDEVRSLEIIRIYSDEKGRVGILLDKPGWRERRWHGHRNDTSLVARLTMPCPTLKLLREGSSVSVRVIGRRYAKSFPTGYYETLVDPDSLCPLGLTAGVEPPKAQTLVAEQSFL